MAHFPVDATKMKVIRAFDIDHFFCHCLCLLRYTLL